MVCLHSKSIIAVKSIKQRVKIHLSGWMVAALRSFGPLHDQSMHSHCPCIDKEIYDFLRQADAIGCKWLFRRLEKVRMYNQIDNFETHIVPIVLISMPVWKWKEATYLLTKKNVRQGPVLSSRKSSFGC
jgi:isocitrate lyase